MKLNCRHINAIRFLVMMAIFSLMLFLIFSAKKSWKVFKKRSSSIKNPAVAGSKTLSGAINYLLAPPNTFFSRSDVLAAGLLRIFTSSTAILSNKANKVLSAT